MPRATYPRSAHGIKVPTPLVAEPKSTLCPPQPWLTTTSGSFGPALAGNVTVRSSGTPSNVFTLPLQTLRLPLSPQLGTNVCATAFPATV